MHENNSQTVQPTHPVFLEYLNILWRRKWIIIICLVVLVLPVIRHNQTAIPIYEAEASIIYEEPKDAVLALETTKAFYEKAALVNLTEQLRSRTLAEDVARSLPKQIIQSFRSPENRPSDFSVDKYIGRKLRGNLNVVQVRNADILRIQVKANNPTAAKIITNTYIDRIKHWNLRKKREEISSVREVVDKQLIVFQEKLNIAEDALRVFKEETKVISLSNNSEEILNRMTQAEVEYNQVKSDRAALEERIRAIQQKKQELAPSLTVVSSPRAQQLKQQLIESEIEYSSNQLQDLNKNTASQIALQQRISKIKQELIEELLRTAQRENLIDPLSQIKNLLQESITLEVDLATYKAREEGLQKIIDNYDAEFQTMPKQELMLARLIRDRDVNNKIYSMLLEKREELRITEAGKIGDIHIIDAAEEPGAPISPTKGKNLALSFVLALALGIGLALFLEYLDTSLKTQEEVERYVNLPVLATIPSIQTNGKFHFIRPKPPVEDAYTHKLVSEFRKTSHAYEAYRALQVNFAFASADRPLKTILMTSSGIREGKTLNSVNIAQTFANSGVKTLLLDCDLRRPMLHKVFHSNKEPGLTNVLINNLPPSAAIQKLKLDHLYLLTSGTLPPSPSELLNTVRMRELLAELRQQFELIIIDSPPIIAMTDSIILATEVDGVCLVIQSGRTSLAAAVKAKQLLENSHARIIGAVLNDIDIKRIYGNYGYYYYYNYYYYHNGKDGKSDGNGRLKKRVKSRT